jgi:hypothetical protein
VKHNTKRAILSAAGVLLSAGNALAAGDLMNNAVNSLDPAVQPWAQTAVTILRAGFVLCVSGGILYYGGLYFLQKKQGHTSRFRCKKS